jgi:hypothetical protein
MYDPSVLARDASLVLDTSEAKLFFVLGSQVCGGKTVVGERMNPALKSNNHTKKDRECAEVPSKKSAWRRLS